MFNGSNGIFCFILSRCYRRFFLERVKLLNKRLLRDQLVSDKYKINTNQNNGFFFWQKLTRIITTSLRSKLILQRNSRKRLIIRVKIRFHSSYACGYSVRVHHQKSSTGLLFRPTSHGQSVTCQSRHFSLLRGIFLPGNSGK